MNHFSYRNGVLHAEAVNLVDLAAAVGTPFYCYSTATLVRHYQVFAGAFADVPALVCYAMKANSNQAVLKTLADLGAGADVVSEGELRRARAAGIPPGKIMFSGVGKTARELALAVDEGILCINVESEPELELCRRSRAARGARRISRCASIPTSTRAPMPRSRPARPRTSSAFRSAARARSMPSAAKLPGLQVAGVDMHIGSQITELEPFDDAFALLSDFVRVLRADGHAISHVDLGGGLGIPYRDDDEPPPHPDAYAADGQARHARSRLHADLRARPAAGRQCRHPGDARALSEARRGQEFHHRRCRDERPDPSDAVRGASRDHAGARAAPGAARIVADVVGPVCESGDFLALDRDLPSRSRATCWR